MRNQARPLFRWDDPGLWAMFLLALRVHNDLGITSCTWFLPFRSYLPPFCICRHTAFAKKLYWRFPFQLLQHPVLRNSCFQRLQTSEIHKYAQKCSYKPGQLDYSLWVNYRYMSLELMKICHQKITFNKVNSRMFRNWLLDSVRCSSFCSVSSVEDYFCFILVFVVLRFELRAYTVSHSTIPFCEWFCQMSSFKLFAPAGFKLLSSLSLPPE
jgi:hypothetical protein